MRQEPFEIRQLRYFLEVADAESFSRAAKRLEVSQPTVSQRLRDLEACVRAVLLQRRGKRTMLTPAGLLFPEHAHVILRQIDQSLQELSSGRRDPHGTLRTGVIPYLDVALMPRLLGAFSSEHPAIDLSILETSSSEIEKDLEEGRLDVGLGWVTGHSPNLRYEHLCDDRFTVVVSETHAWAKRRAVDLTEMHGQRLLQLPDTYVMRRMTDEMCRNGRIRPRTIAEINSIETLLRSLAPLQAVGLMPRISLGDAATLGLKSIPLEGRNLALEIGLLRLVGSGTNSLVAAFIKLAKAVVPKVGKERRI
ncbi:MAG TPA: LysR substrate-binding domain-containing protein [Chthoniobacterales bacterium]|nr:LysR substrate-binding domain-containing protein [Chthoniobacterales bacterium]